MKNKFILNCYFFYNLTTNVISNVLFDIIKLTIRSKVKIKETWRDAIRMPLNLEDRPASKQLQVGL